MSTDYNLLDDPLFYITLGFFALITTALPAALGQVWFLPIGQTLALFVFLTLAVRRRALRPALTILGIWLAVQLVALILVTWLLPAQVEGAIRNGFDYRTSFLAWFYAGEPLPNGLRAQPLGRLVELVGVLVGSLLTGGLAGVWFLVRATNLAAFGAGSLWASSEATLNGLGGLPLWTLLRLAGYAGGIVLLAEPLLTRNWSFAYYLTERRTLILVAILLLVSGLLLELILPNAWRALFT